MAGSSASHKGLGERGRPPGGAVVVQCAVWAPSCAAVDECGRGESPRRPGQGGCQQCNGNGNEWVDVCPSHGVRSVWEQPWWERMAVTAGRIWRRGLEQLMCNPKKKAIAVRQLEQLEERAPIALLVLAALLFKSFQKVRPEILALDWAAQGVIQLRPDCWDGRALIGRALRRGMETESGPLVRWERGSPAFRPDEPSLGSAANLAQRSQVSER
ncbi:hypothetical protein QBC47DRAFT_359407 [Echria macrotheca]|uniref:Uncharacterized protein n=1 Tax=Echria macrotheca TaxID=438768 RepID=A0AAJ0BGR3_9PEZI|nr:hypothetical protein QBC47DRAFT_359407 [Echria macrotheca]